MSETTWAYYERLHREACIREWQLKQQLESCQSQLKDAVEMIDDLLIILDRYDDDYKRARQFLAKYRGNNNG